MSFQWELLLFVFMAYLIGSIPTAVWAGKWFFGIDVREHGSGNAGATNALRVLGIKTGIGVLLVDALKGIGAVALSFFVREAFHIEEWFVIYQLLLGGMALLGHVFPLFASFRGGKGIATLAGIVIILFPEAVLFCLGVFLLLFIPSRYVSLGSIGAAIFFPVAVIWIFPTDLMPKIIFSLAVAVFVPLTHKKNIRRLMKGQENKISFRKK